MDLKIFPPRYSPTQDSVFEIWCYHSGDLEDNPLLGFDTVQLGTCCMRL